MKSVVGAVADAPPDDKRLVGSGAYSIRLADIDTRLDHITVLHGEISERLRHIEDKTAESSKILNQLWVSIRRHPLLSKFIREH